MKVWARNQKGFTIVELLIVIIVIAILAAITIIAYNGIQQRGRDDARKADFRTLVNALESYHADKGAYPSCSTGVAFQTGTAAAETCGVANIAAQLAPTYISKVPVDQLNVAPYTYYYAVGFQKDPNTCAVDYTPSKDGYILGVKLESTSTGACSGYWSRNDINYLVSRNGS